MLDYYRTLQLLLKKYNEASEQNDVNKMKVYEREIRNLKLINALSNYMEDNMTSKETIKSTL